MSIVRLLSNPRQHRQRGHFYRMYGTRKYYPPQHALLNVGFTTILRRTDCFILIWTCSAVLPDHRHCHFQNYPQKQERSFVLLPCRVSKRCLFKLHGRSHPAHNAARMVYHTDHRPCRCQGIKELKGTSRDHGLKGLDVEGF